MKFSVIRKVCALLKQVMAIVMAIEVLHFIGNEADWSNYARRYSVFKTQNSLRDIQFCKVEIWLRTCKIEAISVN